jgi:lysyl-tRNA synthetase class 1
MSGALCAAGSLACSFPEAKGGQEANFDVIRAPSKTILASRRLSRAGMRNAWKPVWHIHSGNPPREDAHLSFAVLLNLASVCHTRTRR